MEVVNLMLSHLVFRFLLGGILLIPFESHGDRQVITQTATTDTQLEKINHDAIHNFSYIKRSHISSLT